MTKQEFIDAVLREFPREIGGWPTYIDKQKDTVQDVVVLPFYWFDVDEQVSAVLCVSGRELKTADASMVTRKIDEVVDKVKDDPLFHRERKMSTETNGQTITVSRDGILEDLELAAG